MRAVIFVFPYLNGSYSNPEKLLLTLYQVSAMSQADLTKVLGWDDYTTSRVITSLNGGKSTKIKRSEAVKIGELPEHLGSRNSGKIRTLTRSGLELAGSMTGAQSQRPLLTEGEARTIAFLAKFAVEYANFPGIIYYGPHTASWRFQVNNPTLNQLINTTSFMEVFDDEVPMDIVWLTWISEAMPELAIQRLLEEWRSALLQLSTVEANRIHYIVAVCQTERTAQRVTDQANALGKKYVPRRVVSLDNLNHDIIF